MAEAETGAHAAKGGLDVLKQKVGPLPLYAWAVAAVVIYYYMARRSKASASTTGTGSAVPNQQTDPAGNIGSIDPATGYVYGTPEDNAALAANNGGGLGTTSGSGSTTSNTYTTNADWGRAAINYLVGLGVDATEANNAIENYLSSQTLSTQDQADVNLAIQGLGAPPDPPSPGTSTNPVTTPTPGTVYASNPPTGLAVLSKTANTVQLSWNKVTNATGYTITYSTPGDPAGAHSTTTSGTQAGVTIGGLVAGDTYTFNVQGTPAKTGDPSASTTVTTPVQTTSSGTSYAANPVTGLKTSGVTSSDVSLSWAKSANATGYTIQYMTAGDPAGWHSTTATGTGVTIGGLVAKKPYTFKVQATPAASGAAWASTSATTT